MYFTTTTKTQQQSIEVANSSVTVVVVIYNDGIGPTLVYNVHIITTTCRAVHDNLYNNCHIKFKIGFCFCKCHVVAVAIYVIDFDFDSPWRDLLHEHRAPI